MADSSALVDLLRRARALAFDFDGTLVDSNPIKRRAFERCFAEFPDQREEIVAYCSGHHHTPRGDKFRHVYEQILKRPYTPEVAAALHECFEDATTRQIVEAPAVPGAAAFLRLVSRSHMTALLSSTPHETLLRIVQGRGWESLFRVVRGAPVEKGGWLRELRDRHGLAPEELIFFGDSSEDAGAAEAAGCAFIPVSEAAASSAEPQTFAEMVERLAT